MLKVLYVESKLSQVIQCKSFNPCKPGSLGYAAISQLNPQ